MTTALILFALFYPFMCAGILWGANRWARVLERDAIPGLDTER